MPPSLEVDMQSFYLNITPRGEHYQVDVKHQDIHSRELSFTAPLDLAQLKAEDHEPRKYGRMLGSFLFDRRLQQWWKIALHDGRPFRFIPVIRDPQLLSLHWQWLQAPLAAGEHWDFMTLNERVLFSLQIPTQSDHSFPLLNRSDFKMLLLVASPPVGNRRYGLAHFDAEEMLAGIAPHEQGYPVDVLGPVQGSVGPATFDALCDRLSTGNYSVLHIVAHGMYRPEEDEAVLFFLDDEGQVAHMGSEQILAAFNRMDRLPHLVFLSCCQSADQGAGKPQKPDPFIGLGQHLVRDLGIPWVVAMRGFFQISTALKLQWSFYRELFSHSLVDVALTKTYAGSGEEDVDLLVPLLLGRTTAPLFEDHPDAPLKGPEIRRGLAKLWPILDGRMPADLLSELKKRAGEVDLSAPVSSMGAVHPFLEELAACYQEVTGQRFAEMARGAPPPDDPVTGNPFLGLKRFTRNEVHLFFGRETILNDLTRLLSKHPVLLISGLSGSGKSSLIAAGLVPRLEAVHSGIVTIRLKPGDDLAQLKLKTDRSSLILVDHLEAMFQMEWDQTQRNDWCRELLGFTGNLPGRLRLLVLVIRVDFLGQLGALNELEAATRGSLRLVPPLAGRALMEVLVKQAGAVGLRLERNLDQVILRDLGDDPGLMPLAQQLFYQLFTRRRGPWLTLAEYEKIGGLQKALANHADRVIASFSNRQLSLLDYIFSRLVDVREAAHMQDSLTGGRAVLRNVPPDRLRPGGSSEDEVKVLLDRLIEQALLSVSSSGALCLVHESLIYHWPWLGGVLQRFAALNRLTKRMQPMVEDWQQRGAVWNQAFELQPFLEETASLAREHPRFLSDREWHFLRDCRRLTRHKIEQKKALEARNLRLYRRTRVFAVAVSIAFVLLTTFIVLFVRESRRRSAVQADHLATQAGTLADRGAFSEAGGMALKALDGHKRFFSGPHSAAAEAQLYRSYFGFRSQGPLLDHKQKLTGMETGPHGRLAISWTSDEIRVWETNGQLIGRLQPAENGRFLKAKFLPDGAALLVIQNDHRAGIWELPQLKRRRVLEEIHRRSIHELVFNHSATQMASAADDGLAVVWDTATWTAKYACHHVFPVKQILFLPESRGLITADRRGGLYHWREQAGSVTKRVLQPPNEGLSSGDFRNIGLGLAGERLFTLDREGTVRSWDLEAQPGQEPVTIAERVVQLLLPEPGKPYLICLDKAALVQVFPLDLEKPNVRPTPWRFPIAIGGDQLGPIAMALHPAGPYLGALYRGGQFRLWEIHSGSALVKLTSEQQHPQDFRFGVLGTKLFLRDGGGKIDFVDLAELKRLFSLGNERHRVLNGVHLGQKSKLALGWSGAVASLRGWGRREKSQLLSFHKNAVSHGVFDGMGRYVATADIKGKIALWQLPEGRFLRSFVTSSIPLPISGRLQMGFGKSVGTNGNRLAQLRFDSRGELLAACTRGGDLFVWKTSGESVFQTAGAHRLPIGLLSFGESGRRLISGGRDQRLVLWDLDQKKPLWEQGSASATRVGASSDGRFFAVFDSERQQIKVHRFRNGRLLKAWPCRAPADASLSFSPDGGFLALFGPEAKARIWRWKEGMEVIGMEEKKVLRLVFSPSSQWFFVGYKGGKGAIYRLDKGRALIKASLDLAAPLLDACFWNERLIAADSRGVVSQWPLLSLKKLKSLASTHFEGD